LDFGLRFAIISDIDFDFFLQLTQKEQKSWPKI
jgi:hypothetical protein